MSENGREAEKMGVTVSEKQSWLRDLEAVISRVRAVVAARVVTDDDDNIETIHVLATGERTADQIVGDIESVCAALFDLYIDPVKVRISQPDEPEPEPSGGAGRSYAFTLHSLTVETGGDVCRVSVKLRVEDGLYVGDAQGPDVPGLRPRLSAEATLAAVAQFYLEANAGAADDGAARNEVSAHGDGSAGADSLRGNGFAYGFRDRGLVLYDLQQLSVGPGTAVVATLASETSRRLAGSGALGGRGNGSAASRFVPPASRTDEQRNSPGSHHRPPESPSPPLGGGSDVWLLGCALVEKDLADAAVRAVLDAVNRSLYLDGIRVVGR